MSDLDLLGRLGIALAIGLLIGIERGWHNRNVQEGQRVAGLRTFGLIGLLGGVCALLARETAGIALLPAGLLLVGTFLGLGYWVTARKEGVVGVTTEVAALLTFTFGAAAGFDLVLVAVTGAVATAVLLGTKEPLHGWVAGLEQGEIYAALKLLLITVVVLPLLPREAVDPWGVLVPYQVWWFVVLFAGLSFAGYVAVRALGSSRGLGLTAVFGGLVSSTATAISFARLAKKQKAPPASLAAGIVLASSIMPLRMLALVAVANRDLLRPLVAPLGAMAVAGGVSALVLRRGRGASGQVDEVRFGNPVELLSAIKFGVLLVVVLVLSEVLRLAFGNAGVYALSAVSGFADADAAVLSLSSLSRDSLAIDVAVGGIVLASCVNGVAKALYVGGIERGVTARRVAFGTAAMAGAAVLGFLLREQVQLP